MSITLDLSPEEEALLQREAQERGMNMIEYIRARVFAPAPDMPPSEKWNNELEFLRREGTAAICAAQERLLAQNIGYVYSRDGVIVRHNADGSEEILSLDDEERLLDEIATSGDVFPVLLPEANRREWIYRE